MENSKKIFTNNAITLATFFGGPLSAGLLISKNYKVFGNDDAARSSIFIGILSTVILFAVIFLTPEYIIEKVPQTLIPFLYTAIIAALVEKLQGKRIKDFLANNGQKASNWQASGYGLIGLLIIGAFLTLMIFVIPTAGYEKKINVDNNVILHYNKKIDETISQSLSLYIKESGFMEGSEGADLFFSNETNNYKLKFVLIDSSALSDTKLMSDFNTFEKFINYNLGFNKKVEIGFTDINLINDFELVEMDNLNLEIYEPLLYLQFYEISKHHSIFYNTIMPMEDVKIVEDVVIRLKAYFPTNQSIDIIFLNYGTDYIIKFFVIKKLWQNIEVVNKLKSTVEYIQDSGINKNIKLVLVDIKTFEEISI